MIEIKEFFAKTLSGKVFKSTMSFINGHISVKAELGEPTDCEIEQIDGVSMLRFGGEAKLNLIEFSQKMNSSDLQPIGAIAGKVVSSIPQEGPLYVKTRENVFEIKEAWKVKWKKSIEAYYAHTVLIIVTANKNVHVRNADPSIYHGAETANTKKMAAELEFLAKKGFDLAELLADFIPLETVKSESSMVFAGGTIEILAAYENKLL